MSLVKVFYKIANENSKIEKAQKLGYLLNDVNLQDEIDIVLSNGYTIDDYLFYLNYNFFSYNLSNSGVFEWLNRLKKEKNSSFLDLLSTINISVDFKDIEKYIDTFTKEEFSKIEISDVYVSDGTVHSGGIFLHLLNLMAHSPKAEKIKEFVLNKYPVESHSFKSMMKMSILNGYGFFVDEFIKMAPKDNFLFSALKEPEILKNSDEVLYKIYSNENIINIMLFHKDIDFINDVISNIKNFCKKYNDLTEKYSYILTKKIINSIINNKISARNIYMLNSLYYVNDTKSGQIGIAKAIADSKNIPINIFRYLSAADPALVNQTFSKSQKNIDSSLIKEENLDSIFYSVPTLKELAKLNNLLKVLIISNIESNHHHINNIIENFIKLYINSYGKDINSVYHDFFKPNPMNFIKLTNILGSYESYKSEFNKIQKLVTFPNIQNFGQYVKLKSRQLNLAKSMHNSEINDNLLNVLFNNLKLDIEEDYFDNLIEVLDLLENEDDNINKFLELSEQFKQKGFSLDAQKFVQNISLAKVYVEQLNQFKLNPDSKFVRVMKELTTDFAYVEMFDNVKLYISKAEPKDKNLFKLNASFDDIEFKVLEDSDPLHFRIGIDTDCCQRIGGVGEEAAIDSFINPLAGVLVVTKDYKILSQSYFHYIPNDKGFILDNIEYNEEEVKKYGPITNDKSPWLADIYKKYGNIIQQKNPDIKYIKIGSGYTKIPLDGFQQDSLEEDPRYFKVDEPYTDFSYDTHYNLFKK